MPASIAAHSSGPDHEAGGVAHQQPLAVPRSWQSRHQGAGDGEVGLLRASRSSLAAARFRSGAPAGLPLSGSDCVDEREAEQSHQVQVRDAPEHHLWGAWCFQQACANWWLRQSSHANASQSFKSARSIPYISSALTKYGECESWMTAKGSVLEKGSGEGLPSPH